MIADEWIKKLTGELDVAKKKGRKHHFIMDAIIAPDDVGRIKFALTNLGFSVTINKCKQCSNKYDIIIDIPQG